MRALFRDRREAGQLLASRLWRLARRPEVRVVALARGGVPVAHEVATALGVPLSVLPVRRVAVPGDPATSLGAVGPGGAIVVRDEVARARGVAPDEARAVASREAGDLARSAAAYGEGAAAPDVEGKVAVVIDDGIASGTTARIAVAALRALGAAQVIVAVPVASREGRELLAPLVDGWVVAAEPEPFGVIGSWYEHFPRVTDGDVREVLASGTRAAGSRPELSPA